MRIAILTDTYYPIYDGVVRFVEYLARALRDNGHTPVIIAPKVPKRFYLGDEKHEPGIEQIRVPVLPVTVKDYFLTLPSYRLFSAIRSCDMIIVNSLSLTIIYALGFNKILKKPVYQFIHHDEYELAKLVFGYPDTIVNIFMKFFMHMTMSMQRFAIATDKFYEKTLRFGAKPEQIFRVPFVYEKEDVTREQIEEFRKIYNIPDGNKILLYLGRLANEKNVLTIFEVFKHFSQMKDVTCIMVGRGYHLIPLRQRVEEEGLNIILTGRLHDRYLPVVYTIADMLVTPTFHETLCFTVVEALNYHTIPVVNGKYHEPSLSEDNTIFIKNIKDKNEIIEKVSQVLFDDEKLRKMQKNTEEAAKYHSYDVFAKIWAEEVAKVENQLKK
ncbi:MAG: glycosyltransferase [Methanobacteriota archaeon]|nr:MAG: glycosyltransferase [Euryarchaeota archaeon]